MSLHDALCNRLTARPFLVNSLPKSGTHLLAKAVALLPGLRHQAAPLRLKQALRGRLGRRRPVALHLGRSTLDRLRPSTSPDEPGVPVGVDAPRPVPASSLRHALRSLRRGHYATAHLPFSSELAALLGELRIRTLLILRDPRDIVVSHAAYIARSAGHFLHEHYRELSESDRIMLSIVGVEAGPSGSPALLGITERCRSVLPWVDCELNHTARFEKLVGPEGGGSPEAQWEELESIARHLRICHHRADLERCRDALFGGTATFRRGMIGTWRRHFSADHKSAFKARAGDLLVELGYERSSEW